MKISLELYASLMHLLPPGKARFRREIKVADDASVQEVIDEYHILKDQAHIVLVNGKFVCDEREEHALTEGDVLSIWPPVAGG